MSVRCIDRVLDLSAHSGTELLMLVVLADYSDDEGNSYPAVSSLARKCRMTPRNANYILLALQAGGELRVMKNQGPKGTNRYRIMLDALGQSSPLKIASPLKKLSPLNAASSPEEAFTLKPTSATPEAGFSKPLKPTSDEPSLNRQEPSGRSLSRPKRAKLPACPHEEIVDAYHEILPELPRALLMEAKGRKDKISDFWGWVLTSKRSNGTRRAETPEDALAFIRTYFERARSNDFIMNRGVRSEAHAKWRADLEYVIGDKGRVQVIERTEVTA
jgi:hypothetical protein